MIRRPRRVTTCPDCGGILQSTVPEPLTSADIQNQKPVEATALPRQCLICGYEEAPDAGSQFAAAL